MSLPGLKENIPLAPYTSVRVGGPARYFLEASSEEELLKAISFAREREIPFHILGSGSNTLVSDEGFEGLVVKLRMEEWKKEEKDAREILRAQAGVPLSALVELALKEGYANLYWAVGVPGTVGGAVYGNAGTPKTSAKDSLLEARVLDARTGSVKIFSNAQCGFSYRHSVFKEQKHLIVLSATFNLVKGDGEKLKEEIREFLAYRRSHQPLEFPSMGSTFKNPPGKSAGGLIESVDLKGYVIGGAQFSEKHANFIVNRGGATAKDIISLIRKAKGRVKERMGITLEEEIQYVGF